MNIQTRVEKLEQASGINKRCPFCTLAVPMPPNFRPEDYIAGACPLCGAAVNFDVSKMTAREREVCAALKALPFGGAIGDMRASAMACWLDRRQKERQSGGA